MSMHAYEHANHSCMYVPRDELRAVTKMCVRACACMRVGAGSGGEGGKQGMGDGDGTE
jgi:hypothetical protein